MRIVVVLVIVLASSALNAQVKGYLGVRGGGHFSRIYLEQTVGRISHVSSFKPGYHGGIMLKLFTNQSPSSFLNAGLQTSLIYESKGWNHEFPTDEPTYHITMDYVSLPLEAIIYAGKKKTKVFWTLGVFLEQLVNVKKDPDPNLDNLGNQQFFTYQSDRDKSFGYGIRTSVGIHRDFPFGALHLDGFFSFSVSNFIRAEDLSGELPDLTNHYLGGFTLAYLIPFGKMEFSK